MKGIQNILIIASDQSSSELSKKLVRKGYHARHASTPDEGLILLTEEKPDLVLVSLNRHDEGGLKCLQEISLAFPRTLVIVAADCEDSRLAIECMRRGAQDYLIRPLSVGKLMNCMERIQNRQRCLFAGEMPDTESVISEQKIIRFGNDLEKIPFIINQAVMNAQAVCPDMEMLKMALGEILLNAVEHGNLNISMEEKAAAVKNGTFENLIKQRKKHPSYASRLVTLQVLMDLDILQFVVTDQGDGFEYQKEYDPDPHAHIGSGLGVQIARNFFNGVIYEGCGNKVRLIYQREPSARGRTEAISMMHDDLIVQLTKSFPSGLLLVSGLDRIIMWNTMAEEITSIKGSEIVGKTTSEAPKFIRDLLSEENSRIHLYKGDPDPSTIEKSLHTLEPKEGGKYSVVLFTDATDSLRQREEMERLLMESAETRDLMEEQAAKLAITLAEMEEKNEIIKDQNQRMIGELEMAARLQKSLLPDTFESLNGVSFSCKYIPSIHIGGDLYDVVDLGGGQTGFIIADVSGHGVAAALISSMFKMSFHALAATVASPNILMHMLNREMKPVLDEDYITAFFVLTDRFGKNITYTNAGHPTPLLFKRSTGEIIEVDTDGFFLGSFDDGGYGEKVEACIEMGDALLMYTDCILETENSAGEQYGKERLMECFRNAVHGPRGNAVIEAIEADVRSFNCKEAFDDDFTVMLLEFWEDADVRETLPKKDGSGGFVEF
ncbi:MAG: SpoIIE family protein phosphatase [Desulfobacterota bacterium]|jgi:serine phosphatase RsbU (regulator of sigma subunit)/response regulator of citrate/malate metabolism|nr:SpoIIE family protein phosphatase [Thermodesulfobacteriota bacterium]